MHFHLFEHVKNLGSASGLHVFDFADMRRSKAVKSLALMFAAMNPNNPVHTKVWSLMINKYGPVSAWPPQLAKTAKTALHMTIAIFWRRFVVLFQSHPWFLARMVDARLSDEERMNERQKFVDANPCCLDAHCSARLRLRYPTVDALAQEIVQTLLTQFFSHVLLTTSHMEDAFAHLRTIDTQGLRPQHIKTLSSRHFLKEFLRAWRLVVQPSPGPGHTARPPRPLVVQSARSRVHDQHSFSCGGYPRGGHPGGCQVDGEWQGVGELC